MELKNLFFNSIGQNVHGISRIRDCLSRMIKEKNCICLVPKLFALDYYYKYRNPDKSPIIKIVEPPIFHDVAAFGFEKGSPYAEKFDAGFAQFLESGIRKKWEKESAFIAAKPDVVVNQGADLVQLVVVLFVGYAVALFVFIFELFKLYCHS